MDIAELKQKSVAELHTLAEQLTRLPGVSLLFPDQPFLWEFAVQLPVSAEGALKRLEREGIESLPAPLRALTRAAQPYEVETSPALLAAVESVRPRTLRTVNSRRL